MLSARAGVFLCAAVALAIMGGGCSGDRNDGRGAMPEVAVCTVHTQSVNFRTTLAGRVSAFQISEVRPQVTGILQARLFEEGGDVKEGQVLYQIDPAVYIASYDSAKASLSRAEANVLPAKLKFDRYKSLVGINAVSRQEYEDADAAYKQTLADVAVCKAALLTARINLDYTKVTSPISGRISRSSVTPGALLTQNQSTALATVQQIDPVYVDMPQSATELLQLKRNLDSGRLQRSDADNHSLRLFLEDGTEYPDRGTLQFQEVRVDESTGSVTLRAIFPNHEHVILPGMYVRVELDEGTNDQTILLPQEALIRDAKGNASVYLVNENSVVEVRPISVGRIHGVSWVVLSGLHEGERVVTSGLQKIRPGQAVKVLPSESAPQVMGGDH